MSSRKDTDESEQDICQDVYHSDYRPGLKTLDCEGRECGKCPNHANAKKDTCVTAEFPDINRFVHENTHDETTEKIDKKRSWKGHDLLVDEPAQNRSEKTPRCDEGVGIIILIHLVISPFHRSIIHIIESAPEDLGQPGIVLIELVGMIKKSGALPGGLLHIQVGHPGFSRVSSLDKITHDHPLLREAHLDLLDLLNAVLAGKEGIAVKPF